MLGIEEADKKRRRLLKVGEDLEVVELAVGLVFHRSLDDRKALNDRSNDFQKADATFKTSNFESHIHTFTTDVVCSGSGEG